MERQILITHWVGNAQEALCRPKYEHIRQCCWKKTDCFMTADGSHGKKIKAKCLINYQVKPDISPVAETHPTPNNAIGNDVLETQNT